MRTRVLLLGAGELLLVAGGLVIIGRQDLTTGPRSVALVVGYTLVVTVLVLLPRMFVEFRRHAMWLTPADVAMMVGLFGLGPYYFVAAGMLAECVAALKHRQSPLKAVFNLVHMAGGLVAAGTSFALIGRTDPLDPVAWLAGAVAIAACVTWDLLSTTAVLAIAERHPYRVMLARLAPTAAVGLVVSVLLGIAALVLFHETPYGPLLFAPVLAILVVSTRGVATQRAERLHFERLYAASSNLAELVGLDDMLGKIAIEARGLVTGASAICCTVAPDGTSTGILVDDTGTRTASPATLEALGAATADDGHGQLAITDLDRPTQARLPPCQSVVWAATRTTDRVQVLLAVFRELPVEEPRDHQPEVLTAFVTHAAAVVANVGLHAAVQRALDRQVELNEQKSQFVAAVSHELRTPLTAMIGSVQTVKRLADRLSESERDRVLEMGLSQGSRLQGLIENLLLVAAADHRDAPLRCEALSVSELFASLDAELAPLVGEQLHVHVEDETARVLADEDKVRRIVLNLVENARKYAPEGPIELTGSREGDTIAIAVRDHGPGIRPQDRERVFERFVQLDQSSTRRQGGTGLGLFLCRELAGWQDGSLVLEAPSDGGSRFVLRLPAANAAPAPAGRISCAVGASVPGPAGTGVSSRAGAPTAAPGGLFLQRPTALPRPLAPSATRRGVVATPVPLITDVEAAATTEVGCP